MPFSGLQKMSPNIAQYSLEEWGANRLWLRATDTYTVLLFYE